MIGPASPVADEPRRVAIRSTSDGAEGGAAEGPPRTRTGRGINRAGATPSSHICQARPSPLRRRRARSSTLSATAHSSSTASGSATAAAGSLSRRRPWLGGALSTPRSARASGSAAASNRRHDAEAREVGEHCDGRPGCIPAPPIRPPSMPTLIPAESAHAARSALPARQAGVMGASQDWPMPSTCHGFSACLGSPGGQVG